jgi:Icc-related predicted phosphoesterase
VIRVAAVADVHFGEDSAGTLAEPLQAVGEQADVLLVAGDLTRGGLPEEAQVLADELAGLETRVIAVLGNHDYHADREQEVRAVMEAAGVTVLEGDAVVVEANGSRLGVAGGKGFGGGFAGASGTDFGEPEMKAFVRHTKQLSDEIETALEGLDGVDARVALLHYSPVPDTLRGERLEIYPFLGSYLLGEAIDRAGASLVLHGHAHGGVEQGVTPGGHPVRNVALPVIRQAYRVYELH